MLHAALFALRLSRAAHGAAVQHQRVAEREGKERAAVDYISGMTDGYAMEKFGEIYIPFSWSVK